MNAYEILECRQDVSDEELKASYHRLLLIHHPDKQISEKKSDIDLEKFIKLQSAYRLLSDRKERASYDSLMRQIELKQKAEHLIDVENDLEKNHLLALEKDFDFDASKAEYGRKCRCGSQYLLKKEVITKFLRNFANEKRNDENKEIEGSSRLSLSESLIICLECDTCSLFVNVLII